MSERDTHETCRVFVMANLLQLCILFCRNFRCSVPRHNMMIVLTWARKPTPYLWGEFHSCCVVTVFISFLFHWFQDDAFHHLHTKIHCRAMECCTTCVKYESAHCGDDFYEWKWNCMSMMEKLLFNPIARALPRLTQKICTRWVSLVFVTNFCLLLRCFGFGFAHVYSKNEHTNPRIFFIRRRRKKWTEPMEMKRSAKMNDDVDT